MTPSVSVDAVEGVAGAVNLKLLGVDDADTGPFEQGGVARLLPTACYAFRKGEETLVAAAAVTTGDINNTSSFAAARKRGCGLWLAVVVGMVVAVL